LSGTLNPSIPYKLSDTQSDGHVESVILNQFSLADITYIVRSINCPPYLQDVWQADDDDDDDYYYYYYVPPPRRGH